MSAYLIIGITKWHLKYSIARVSVVGIGFEVNDKNNNYSANRKNDETAYGLFFSYECKVLLKRLDF